MQAHSLTCSRSGSRDGIALVMVLAFIVLLTILIVSFIAFTKLNRVSTASYSKAIQAQEIAQGGLQDILQDVHTEIVAGSSNYVVGTGSYASAYIPKTNVTAAPAHLGYAPVVWGNDVNSPNQDNLAPTLLRVSRASQDTTHPNYFYPSVFTNTAYYDGVLAANLINRASASNTSTPSANGRSISAARWNNTFLLACSSTTNTGDDPYYLPGVFVSTNYLSDPNYSGSTLPSFTGPSGPPDWVYVTRSGSRVCNAATEMASLLPSANVSASYTVTPGSNPPAAPIVGRYAYVMYDEGGTLDVNAAGFYSSTPVAQAYAATNAANVYAVTNSAYFNASPKVSTTQDVMGKSFIADADLSVLLGPQTAVNNLIAWRNASIATLNNVNYLNAAFNYAQKGFLSFQSGDSPMVSRQDLIHYFAKVDPTFDTDTPSPGLSRALPYLGTFSRAVSAPSYSPPADATTLGAASNGTGNMYAYHTNAELATVNGASNPNRDLANVRFANAGAITHYYDDQSPTSVSKSGTYNVNVGDPLLQSRFSLAKIGWLSQVDPNLGPSASLPAAYQTPIQACFGLTWGVVGVANGGNPCWSYVGSPAGPSGTLAAFNGTIETLDQVAKEGREPNFFELLKAAILNGSVGMSPGPAGFSNGTIPVPGGLGRGNAYTATTAGTSDLYGYSFDRVAYTWPTVPAKPSPNGISDMHIMQIGVNIIDQFGSSSYPTAIYFPYKGITAANDASIAGNQGFGRSDMVYGDKNLPYLLGFINICATTDGLPVSGYDGSNHPLAMWWQPFIWNPHQMPNPANGGSAPPQNFQINGYGQLDFWWQDEGWTGNNQGGPGQGPPWIATSPSPTGSIPYDTCTPQTLANTATGAPIQYISFTDTSPTTSAFYVQPLLLGQKGTAANMQGANITASASVASMASTPIIYNSKDNPFVGFWAGTDPAYMGCPNEEQNGTKTAAQIASGAATFVLGWVDSTGGFHPYSYVPGNFIDAPYGTIYNKGNEVVTTFQPSGGAWPEDNDTSEYVMVDPRTPRFGELTSWAIGGLPFAIYPLGVSDWFPNAGGGGNGGNQTDNYGSGQPSDPNFVYYAPTQYGYPIADWEVNTPNQTAALTLQNGSMAGAANPAMLSGTATYYLDPDGIARPGDGVFGNAAKGDGMPLFVGTKGAATDGTALGDNGGNTQHGRRSVVLNRPFRNVGELGYTYRDLPFKTLDFFTTLSADAGLLDVFSTTDEAQISSNNQLSAVVAGRVNPNDAPSPVLQAILSYGSKKDLDATYNMISPGSITMSQAIATKIQPAAWGTGGVGPIGNRAGLVTQLGANPTTQAGPYVNGAGANPWDKENKAYLESPVRALSNITDTRTWNLLIDIIAQSGHLSPNATTLDNFVVEGEKRYWLHIAIDRYTGKIVDQQLEPVYE